jgi:hypothetical protein
MMTMMRVVARSKPARLIAIARNQLRIDPASIGRIKPGVETVTFVCVLEVGWSVGWDMGEILPERGQGAGLATGARRSINITIA